MSLTVLVSFVLMAHLHSLIKWISPVVFQTNPECYYQGLRLGYLAGYEQGFSSSGCLHLFGVCGRAFVVHRRGDRGI
jgi:hypothetical protein